MAWNYEAPEMRSQAYLRNASRSKVIEGNTCLHNPLINYFCTPTLSHKAKAEVFYLHSSSRPILEIISAIR
jgi:hypothetical protein